MPRRPRTPTVTPDTDAIPAELGQDPPPRTATASRRPIRSAAKSTGNRGKIAARTASGKMMSKAAMVEKVSGEVYMYLSLIASAVETAEEARYGESCITETVWSDVVVPTPDGPVKTERLAGIAERLTAMIARNDKLLARAAQTGMIGDIATIMHLVLPIGLSVWRHHGPMGTGHRPVEESAADEYPSRFPAYTGN
jgi:hypothetical protein